MESDEEDDDSPAPSSSASRSAPDIIDLCDSGEDDTKPLRSSRSLRTPSKQRRPVIELSSDDDDDEEEEEKPKREVAATRVDEVEEEGKAVVDRKPKTSKKEEEQEATYVFFALSPSPPVCSSIMITALIVKYVLASPTLPPLPSHLVVVPSALHLPLLLPRAQTSGSTPTRRRRQKRSRISSLLRSLR